MPAMSSQPQRCRWGAHGGSHESASVSARWSVRVEWDAPRCRVRRDVSASKTGDCLGLSLLLRSLVPARGCLVRRLSAAGLVELAGELAPRERLVIEAAERLRLVSGKQLERLFFAGGTNPASNARLARRTLARLVAHGALGRLERRIGGVRAGAAGAVYFATARGQRLVAYWQGRGLVRPRSAFEPSATFARHVLAISESYATLVEADRAGSIELIDFQGEPGCWLSYAGGGGARQWVKPDAFVRLGVGEYETRTWLEIDCGTEGRGALTRKCRAYLAAYRAGAVADVFPKVVWVTTTEKRVELLGEVCGSLPAEAWKLFAITTPDRMLDVLAGARS